MVPAASQHELSCRFEERTQPAHASFTAPACPSDLLSNFNYQEQLLDFESASKLGGTSFLHKVEEASELEVEPLMSYRMPFRLVSPSLLIDSTAGLDLCTAF